MKQQVHLIAKWPVLIFFLTKETKRVNFNVNLSDIVK